MINDPIADLLTRIRNANLRRSKYVKTYFSKMKNEILTILKTEGYISDFSTYDLENNKKEFIIFLKYKGQNKAITGLKRISKPGLRVYSEAINLPKVLNGYGIAIVSTSKGVMTAENARRANLGGEVLAFVW